MKHGSTLIIQSIKELLSAREAAALLGVKLPTLYAYVSRGLLRSEMGEAGRARRYRRSEVEALREKARGARGVEAAGALRWGEPVLDSSITAMTAEGPLYRGEPALALARRGVPFESVAELLWSGTLPASPPRFLAGNGGFGLTKVLRGLPAGTPHAAWQTIVVATLAPNDPARFDIGREAVLSRGRSLIRWLAAGLALGTVPARAAAALGARSVAEAVAAALGVAAEPAKLRAIDRLLVLMADHELNASTFAARVAASAQADPYACVLAGLATLSGPRHGGASDRVEALLAEVKRPEDGARVVHERARRGEHVPGFGHGYYKAGDPRALLLLETAHGVGRRVPEVRAMRAVVAAMAAHERPGPNVDAGAVALRCALGMPRGAVAGIFAVARCAGWIAHIVEQYETGQLLRPRARFAPVHRS